MLPVFDDKFVCKDCRKFYPRPEKVPRWKFKGKVSNTGTWKGSV